MKNKINIGDTVELLINEHLDDHYQEHLQTVVAKGTLMEVVAIAPKVRMVKGTGHDNNPYFLNLIIKESKHKERVRTNFCNVRKVKNEQPA